MHLFTAICSIAVLLLRAVDTVKRSNADTSLMFVYQNNLNASDYYNYGVAILLGSMSMDAGMQACNQLSEPLLL